MEKAEPVQNRFTLRLRDQRSMWLQDGCNVYMDSYMASNGSCFMVTWTIFKNHPLGGRPSTKPGDHGTPTAHNHWFILIYQERGSAWIEIHWNSIWGPRSRMTSHYMILEVPREGLRTLPFGLLQFHGHGLWPVCEVTLNSTLTRKSPLWPTLIGLH